MQVLNIDPRSNKRRHRPAASAGFARAGDRLRSATLLLALLTPSVGAGAQFVVSDPVEAGTIYCGFYVDSQPRVTLPVEPTPAGNICKLPIDAIGAGSHSIVATAIAVDDPVFGSQESVPSIPLVMTTTAIPVIEYYHAGFDHYFITSIPAEIQNLDGGAYGGAWARTGMSFKAWANIGDAPIGAVPVCRVFISYPGGSSHFYSSIAAECTTADTTPGAPLFLESPNVMYVLLADGAGGCPYGTRGVYRIWNQRTDSNHRFTTDANVRDQMVSYGWLIEGSGPGLAVMCAPQ